jgi:alginate O-acetyltransferase complex protein AlgI
MLFYAPGFIFVFLPIVLCGYYLLGKKNSEYSRLWLLGASLVFYSLGTMANLFLLLGSVCGNFYLGKLLSGQHLGRGVRKTLVGMGVALNLGVLAFYKTLGAFQLSGRPSGEGVFMDILIPLGLSFFTLQQVAFLVDSYRGQIRETRFLRYALFICFFPQLIAGPIVRYQEIVPQLDRDHTTVFRLGNLVIGATIFVLGALKKVFIADQLSLVSNAVFNAAAHGQKILFLDGWIGSISFYLQLYFDFSAYSDMAVGIGYMFGIRLPINFDSPYQSRSLATVFLRWHMTLYRFLTDYLMLPLIGFLKKIPVGGALFRTRASIVLSTVITFTLSGVWHGVSWNYICWGLLNGVLISIGYLCREVRIIRAGPIVRNKKIYGLVATSFICLAASVIFRSQTVDQVGILFKAMAGLNGVALPIRLAPFLSCLENIGVAFQPVLTGIALPWSKGTFLLIFMMIMGIVYGSPNIYELTSLQLPMNRVPRFRIRKMDWSKCFPPVLYAVVMAAATVLLVSLLIQPLWEHNEAFIYFQF